jgi:hypothetical protein
MSHPSIFEQTLTVVFFPEANRNTLLSHTQAMSHTIDLLRSSQDTRVQQFSARLVANLCFNNGTLPQSALRSSRR